jgi:NitT/TauT family transport system permease protein
VASIALGLFFYLVTLGLERLLQRHTPQARRRP